MSRTTKSLYLATVGFALGFFCLLIVRPPGTAGQQSFPPPNRKPACTCFCGDATFNSFPIFSAAEISAGKCFGGPLPADVCGQAVNELPAAERAAVCQRLKAGRSASCPAAKAACDGATTQETPKRDCQKPAPWFDPSSDCKDVQAPVVAVNNQAVTVSVCGYPVFRGSPSPPINELALTAYKSVVESHVKNIGSRVCCDKLRDAARTGDPCFPAVDIDCDGTPNDRDTIRDGVAVVPNINLFTMGAKQFIDPLPPGLGPDDPNFMPGPTARESKDVGDCPCKWELTEGKLTCSRDGREDHVYAATWTCPANGKEVLTTKYVKGSEPCQIYKGTGQSNMLFDAIFDRMTDPLAFMPTSLSGRGCR